MAKVLIIGSVNIDKYHYLNHFPTKGETIVANKSTTTFGGKGANQAVACAKFGADTSFLGAIGNDIYSEAIIENFRKNQINTDLLQTNYEHPTGTANILLSENDNIIIVTPGANLQVNENLINALEKKISEYDYVLIQNEINPSALKAIVEIKLKNSFKLIYNPAPFMEIEANLLTAIDYITPNEKEAEALLAKYQLTPEQLIITLGADGVRYCDQIYKAPKVNVVDTTGAGDCFNGVFVSLLAAGKPISECIQTAVNAASISVTKMGAQTGYLTNEELNLELEKLN